MEFETKVQLGMQGYTSDEIEAVEQAWIDVLEPLQIVVKRDGMIYCDGLPRPGWKVDDGDIAIVHGRPVVILEPLPNGDYRWHDVYNPANLEAYRDERYEFHLRQIKKQKRDKQAVKNAPVRVVQVHTPTPEECQAQWDQDFINYYGMGEWKRRPRCICHSASCVHR